MVGAAILPSSFQFFGYPQINGVLQVTETDSGLPLGPNISLRHLTFPIPILFTS